MQDSFFGPYSGSLVRLVLLCAAIHQAVFTALSTIPFAVGQVQDVGLIFMSAIASRCRYRLVRVPLHPSSQMPDMEMQSCHFAREQDHVACCFVQRGGPSKGCWHD